jgi:hypothetical protein
MLLLEDEFERQDIERVINDELSIKDSDRDNLESHQIILKLATTSGDKVRLIWFFTYIISLGNKGTLPFKIRGILEKVG